MVVLAFRNQPFFIATRIRLVTSYAKSRHSSFRTPEDTAIPGPLDGIRILDLTRVLAGPFCTMLLGDLGAEILKVEKPNTGDDSRAWGPPFIEHKSPSCSNIDHLRQESAYFLSVNRNKKSIVIELKSSVGVDIVRQLAAKSDVFVENFLPGHLDSLGLGYADLSKLNPSLIYASITGYGADGPDAHRPGYDVIIEGEAGFMHITGAQAPSGTAADAPVKVGVAITDVSTGLYAHGAILAALYARIASKASGGAFFGQKLDLSLLETQVSTLVNVASNYLIAGDPGCRWGSAHSSIVPYQGFCTVDNRYIIVGAGNDAQFHDICLRMNLKELIHDTRYIHNADRVKNRTTLIDIMQRKFAEKTICEWMEIFKGGSMPYGPVNNIKETFEHPQVLHRKMVETVEHQTYGSVKLTGIPVKYSKTKPTIRLAPPILGEHTKDILQNILHLNDKEIQHLMTINVIQ